MIRYLILLAFSAMTALAAGHSCQSTATYTNPLTNITYPDCQFGSWDYAPKLDNITFQGLSNNLYVYTLYVENMGQQTSPSICFGQPELYDAASNSFPAPGSPAASTASPVTMCRPAVLLSTWNPQSTALQVGLPVALSSSATANPMVMMTNNDTNFTTLFTFPMAGPASPYNPTPHDPVITQTSSQGTQPVSGLWRYGLSGANLSDGSDQVSLQLLTRQYVWVDIMGVVVSRTALPLSATPVGADHMVTAWLPVQHSPQIVSATTASLTLQTDRLAPPLVRGYLATRGGTQIGSFSILP